jgi:hypothetical protein
MINGFVQLISVNSAGYKQSVQQVVSQAAIHLHNTLGQIGTALVDRHGTLLLDNNALHYLGTDGLNRLTQDCFSAPQQTIRGTYTPNADAAHAFALDSQHAFIVVGNKIDVMTVESFVATLRQLLPPAPATDD